MFLQKSVVTALLAAVIASTLIQSVTVAHAEQYGERSEITDFVENPMALTNVYSIDQMGLSKSTLATRPWSDDYWPDTEGGIARRYKPGFMRHPRWSPVGWVPKNADWVWDVNASGAKDDLAQSVKNYASLTEEEIAVMSPAEKYDILLGDENFTFTKAIVQRVDDKKANKLIASFSGICHGWTGAALTMPRPEKVFTAVNPHGKLVTFYPSDVRGLGSYLFAAAIVNPSDRPEQKFNGNNCQTNFNAKYTTDSYNRILDPKCNDVNPAFFHLTLVNQIGVNQRAFIMDRKSQFAVDNQPVFAYKYTYYNPQTGRPVGSVDEAKVPLDGRFDAYNDYRPKQGAKFIVGVNLEVDYVAWVMPGMERTFTPADDKTSKWHTKYDLELNEAGDIIGGEWRYIDSDRPNAWDLAVHFDHPDFLWMPTKDSKAWSSTFEGNLNSSTWNAKLPFPADVKETAKLASSYIAPKEPFDKVVTHVPSPLATVVDWLIVESRK